MTKDPYVSRAGDSAVAERFDPVLWGEGAGPLSAAELQRFEADGFIVKKRLFGEGELAQMMDELARLPGRYGERSQEEVVSEPGTGVVRSVFRVHRVSPLFEKLARDPRLADTARQILGSDVYVHQSRVNFKRAFDGRAFPWHSDFETWHMEDGMPRMRALSASVLLTENTPVNGPLMLIRGSHKRYVRCTGETPQDHYKESLRKQRYGVPSNEALMRLTEGGELVQATGAAGSVIFFDCNTMHGSSGNMSPYPRHNVFFVFNSVENELEAPFCGLPPRPDFLAERSAI
ncbi:MAG: ectoine hydroxylase [Deltaproteobacteria bacterium]|jgi:ectoine hydroxylase|nr:ectoine hydroxylase [Deltaproteobacteria bacterium]